MGKSLTSKNKTLKRKEFKAKDLTSFFVVIVAFVLISIFSKTGVIGYNAKGMLVPVCCYIVMALSLNLTVGVLGELSLGHAGFMSVGAFSGITVAMSLADSIQQGWLRLVIALVVGALCAAVAGLLVGVPVLRLHGDYLAIVTLAFGEIIKDIVNCLLIGHDENGIHFAFNFKGDKTIDSLGMTDTGRVIIKGAQGATGTDTISTFVCGFVLILITLFIITNLVNSRTGRAVLAIRDNRIAAESVGINSMKYKLIVFVISASLAGAAGALYGLNFSNITAAKFDFNTSILVLVFVVLGGLGNMLGSIISASVLYILPEALRQFSDYRMLIYAIVLILVMLATNNDKLKALLRKIIPWKKSAPDDLKAPKKPKKQKKVKSKKEEEK